MTPMWTWLWEFQTIHNTCCIQFYKLRLMQYYMKPLEAWFEVCKLYISKFASMSVSVEVFAAGDGINYPRPGNTVTIHYTGFLPDGRRFDSSRDRGKPFKFKLGCEQVIPGLDLGVAQLSVGERAKITIPSRLAYGDKGFPGLIGKNMDLTFDMELITFT